MRIIYPTILAFFLVGCGAPEAPAPTPTPQAADSSVTAETEVEPEALGPNEFAMPDGDTVYIMKQYFMVELVTGPVRDQDSTTAAELQEGHMAHLDSLANAGKIDIVGPFGDEGEVRGIAIYNCETKEEAEMLANADPAVQAGRLIVRVRPWWCAKGSKLR